MTKGSARRTRHRPSCATRSPARTTRTSLLVTCGEDRAQTYERLAAILRVNKLRGYDLATNLFHYGLVNWFEVDTSWQSRRPASSSPTWPLAAPARSERGRLRVRVQADRPSQTRRTSGRAGRGRGHLLQKQTLKRLDTLLTKPHVLSGWLSLNKKHFALQDGHLVWLENPLKVLRDTYHYLNMEPRDTPPARHLAERRPTPRHRARLLCRPEAKLGTDDFGALVERLSSTDVPAGFSPERWAKVRAAHHGHQLGLEILSILALVGYDTSYFDLDVDERLDCVIPKSLFGNQADMKKVLAPPPATRPTRSSP